MVRRADDHEGMLPWPRVPKDLAVYRRDQFPDVQRWHQARAQVARSLNRLALPEIRGMTRVRRHNNERFCDE
jgi:hypothetical protein